jgi:uncharacterized phage protein (TIGR01671 family)
MRDIEFRGKRTDDDVWVYGSYLENGEESPQIIDFCNTYFDVYVNTTGQYTGLKDRNGEKIFEGDIISWRHTESSGLPAKEITAVFFEEGSFYVKTIDNFYRSGFAPNGCLLYEQYRWFCEGMQEYPQGNFSFEVVGNIHDNPELWAGNNFERRRKRNEEFSGTDCRCL